MKMKKALVLCLLVIMLSGCTEKKNDVEIDVCTDDCILDDSEIEDMRLVYKEKV
jgi:protein involved in sex pheromone biosynthesis